MKIFSVKTRDDRTLTFPAYSLNAARTMVNTFLATQFDLIIWSLKEVPESFYHRRSTPTVHTSGLTT